MLRVYFTLPIFSLVMVCVGCGGDSTATRDRGTGTKAEKPADTDKGDGAKTDDDGGQAATGTADAGEKPAKGAWGTLKGKFVYDGDAPERQKLNITKDVDYCGKFDQRNEELIVGEDGGLANVMVWVRDADIEVHPDYEGTADAVVEANNVECMFQPYVIAMRVGQTLRIGNPDPIAHNSQILFRSNPQFNENIPIKGNKELKPAKEERLPVSMACSIHPWMKAHLLLKETPYTAVSGDDGTFEIANLPTGVDLELQVYHTKSGYVDEVTIDGTATKWSRGRFTMAVAEGENDLGEMRIGPKAFE